MISVLDFLTNLQNKAQIVLSLGDHVFPVLIARYVELLWSIGQRAQHSNCFNLNQTTLETEMKREHKTDFSLNPLKDQWKRAQVLIEYSLWEEQPLGRQLWLDS